MGEQCTEGGKLTVYNSLQSKWVYLFKPALQLFNQLGLPVKITEAADERSANVATQTNWLASSEN